MKDDSQCLVEIRLRTKWVTMPQSRRVSDSLLSSKSSNIITCILPSRVSKGKARNKIIPSMTSAEKSSEKADHSSQRQGHLSRSGEAHPVFSLKTHTKTRLEKDERQGCRVSGGRRLSPFQLDSARVYKLKL